MSDKGKDNKTLEERIKSLEILQRNARIAIIILVGYSIYDVISMDSGSDIIFAHKVKAREFELIDGQGAIYGTWKVLEGETSTAGLVIENASGNQVTVTANEMKFTAGRVNPAPTLIMDETGVKIFDQHYSESNDSE